MTYGGPGNAAGGEHGLEVLRNFLTGYLHQDFPEVHGEVWDAVRDFRADASPDIVARTADEAEEVLVLTRARPDSAVEETLDRLGSCYDATGDGHTYRGWLERLVAVLRMPEKPQ